MSLPPDLKTWAADAIVGYARFSLRLLVQFYSHWRRSCEEPRKGHWYPSVFKNTQVKAFLNFVVGEERPSHGRSHIFTLTTVVPIKTGSLHSWCTLRLLVPREVST